MENRGLGAAPNRKSQITIGFLRNTGTDASYPRVQVLLEGGSYGPLCIILMTEKKSGPTPLLIGFAEPTHEAHHLSTFQQKKKNFIFQPRNMSMQTIISS